MFMKLFLDDERVPNDVFWIPAVQKITDWDVVRNVNSALNYVVKYPQCITHISIDNDLAEELEGYHFVVKLIEYDMDYDILKDDIKFYVHSKNIIRNKDIVSYINNYWNNKFNKNAYVRSWL